MKKNAKNNNKKWFKKVRGSYLPNSWQGMLTYTVFLLYLLTVLITAFNTQEEFAGYLFFVFPQFVAAAVAITFVASKNS